MNKLFAIAAVAALPTVAAAETPASRQFTQGGETYVYTASTKNARQIIDGYNVTTGGRFHLIVRNNMVSGYSNGQSVSFRVPAASGVIETAQR